MSRVIDAAILILCLLAVVGAECIPLMLGLLAAAGALTIWKEVRTMYYHTCPYCGAHLDPGESCACVDAMFEALTPENKQKVKSLVNDLLAEQKNAAQGATNTQDGQAEKVLTDHISASSLD